MNTVTAINVRSRQQWAEIINADWRKSIESIIQTGRDLIAAKSELPHGEFGKMVEADLPFTLITADKLMKVAGDPKIAKYASSTNSLPPSWRVLSALAVLSEGDFEDGIEKGIITANTSLRGADAYHGAVNTPVGGTWGKERKTTTLPPPSEASKIARETGRMVAASDGHVYSGATEEEGEAYVTRRQQAYGVIDAVNALADCPVTAVRWVDQAEAHWLLEVELGAVDAAITWLTSLREALPHKTGVINGK